MKSGWALIFVVALAFRALEAATFTNCITNPTNMDRDNVVEESGILSLSCSTDSTVASCIWRHTDPISEQNQGTSAEPTIMCSGSPETTGRQCTDDTRVTYRTSTSTCAIDVTLPKPEDTGKWYLSAVTFKGSSNQQTPEKTFEVYSFNRSQLFMVDEDMNYETSIDSSYNWDTKEEEYIDGKSGWERIEFACLAYGGRPVPTFRWYINNERNDDLTEDNTFNIATSSIGSDYRYIENYQSSIDFQVDHNLIDKLARIGVDTNPSNGMISFDITCEVTQGLRATYQQTGKMRMNIRRVHDDGNLKGSMIGVIVGVILAVVLLIVAVGLLVFAKSTGRWCFADEYNDVNQSKAHPRAGGINANNPPPASQQQQVYRDNIDKGDDKKTATTRRSSTTSSNNTAPLKSSVAPVNQAKGEWLPDSRKSAHYSASPHLAASPKTTPVLHQPPIVRPQKTGTTSSSSSSSSSSSNHEAPPRPPKDGLNYANLDHRAFMQDPRNKVLPGGNGSSSLPASTTYATVTTKEVTQASSRTFGSSSRYNP